MLSKANMANSFFKNAVACFSDYKDIELEYRLLYSFYRVAMSTPLANHSG